jgi:hypothetical protein
MDSEVLVFHGQMEPCALCRLADGRGFPHRPRYHEEAVGQQDGRTFCRGIELEPYLTIEWQQPSTRSANIATVTWTDRWPVGLEPWLRFIERADLAGADQIRPEYLGPLDEYAAGFWQWLDEVPVG